ncbi:hypothetical protein LTR87_012969 [Friedmanniomyces endolithicus]|nr:hypothetical protein LTR87_012969 [Friedmanniomyces endolithicus]
MDQHNLALAEPYQTRGSDASDDQLQHFNSYCEGYLAALAHTNVTNNAPTLASQSSAGATLSCPGDPAVAIGVLQDQAPYPDVHDRLQPVPTSSPLRAIPADDQGWVAARLPLPPAVPTFHFHAPWQSYDFTSSTTEGAARQQSLDTISSYSACPPQLTNEHVPSHVWDPVTDLDSTVLDWSNPFPPAAFAAEDPIGNIASHSENVGGQFFTLDVLGPLTSSPVHAHADTGAIITFKPDSARPKRADSGYGDGLELGLPASLSQATASAKRRKTMTAAITQISTKQDSQGNALVIFRVHGAKRARFEEKSRIETALTRKMGACPTCRKKKLRCDQFAREKFVPCGRCMKLPPSMLAEPCCRIELIDVKLFRLGSTEDPLILLLWTQSKEGEKGQLLLEDGTTSIEPPRLIALTQDVSTTLLAVTVTRFLPGPADTTAFTWTDPADGILKAFEMPPYYISDMAEAQGNLRRYIADARQEYTKGLLKNSNPLLRKVFAEAERYADVSKNELVTTALLFWSATRMIERAWNIVGDDLLGVPAMQSDIGPCRRNPTRDSVPVTPIMDTQLDELAIGGVLIPLGSKLLRLLKARTLLKKAEHWYEIHLTTLIIMNNFEQILVDFMGFTSRHGMTPKMSSNSGPSLSEGYYHACKTILAFFHHATGGVAPLAIDWLGSPNLHAPLMTKHQLEYLRSIQEETRRQDTQLQALKEVPMYNTEMYWCHQVLLAGWKADTPHRGELLSFTERDFMVS